MADQWFSGPRWKAKKSESKRPRGKTLFVLHFRVFCKQDKDGNILKGEFSELMLKQAAAKFATIVILYYHPHKEEAEPLVEMVAQFSNIEVQEIDNALDAADSIKRRIIDRGGRIKHANNPREITALNMSRFVVDEDNAFEFTHTANAEEIGIEVEKPQSFDDLKKRRAGKSFW